jgi:dTDP-4-dehydrorhamnose 3,5-epimerase
VNVEQLAIEGVFRATPRAKGVRHFDWYRADALAAALPTGWRPGVGSLHTVHRGELSGLYLAAAHRVLTCVTGRISLVVVDARPGTPTYGRWIPIDLEPIVRPTIVIPPGTAWGYQGFTDVAVLLSLHEDDGRGPLIDPLDAALQITWPLPATPHGLPLDVAVSRQAALSAD